MAKMLKDKYGNEFPEGTIVLNDVTISGNSIIGGQNNVIGNIENNIDQSLSKSVDNTHQTINPTPTPPKIDTMSFVKWVGSIIAAVIGGFLLYKFGWN